MQWRDSSARSRELGAELRAQREKAGHKAVDLANRLGWSATKVSRMESGLVAVTEVDAAIYLTYCGVHKEELDKLLDLTRSPETGTWLQEHGTRLPDELRTLIFHETTAESIAYYQPLGVPGLLQTEAYAQGVFEFANILPRDRIPMAVQARMARQAMLRRYDPPKCAFYLPESGLRSKVGTNKIMQQQLLQLVFLTGRPQHQIRILPSSTGPLSPWVGPFMLMGYRDHAPVTYVECLTTSLFIEKPEHINAYQEVLRRLDRAALDTEESREWLVSLASEFDQPEDQIHDQT